MNTATEHMVGKILGADFQSLSPAAARRIVSLQADAELLHRIEYLASRSNEGDLTDDERSEYQACVNAGDILAARQALARRNLQQTTD